MSSIAVRTKLRLSLALASLRHRLVGSHVSAVLAETPQGRFLVPVDDFVVGRRLAFEGAYDSEHIDLYRSLAGPTARVLVVGTHVGTILVPLAKDAVRVVGVEANPETFRYLEWNLMLNGLTNVELHNRAASDEAIDLEFVLSRHNTGGSKVRPREESFEFVYDHPERTTVRGAPLDDLLDDKAFDLIVMDIEGSEYKALLGMQSILSEAGTLVVEVVPNHLDRVAGVGFREFLDAIPERFDEFRFLSSDGPVLSRAQIASAYEELSREAYGSGADLMCRASRER